MRNLKYALSFFTFVLSATLLKAETGNFGYRVTDPSKTVIQIARDVYNDQRVWKHIAYWNNIKYPYSLSVGQVLILPTPPVNVLAQENLVTGEAVPIAKFSDQLPSVKQKIIKKDKHYIYVVNERAPSLSMVAIENYGNQKMAPVIAKWNHLPRNSALSLGQSLVFKIKPSFPEKQATETLIKYWTKLGNADMVARLKGQSQLSAIVKSVTKPSSIPATPVAAEPAPVDTPVHSSNENGVYDTIIQDNKATEPSTTSAESAPSAFSQFKDPEFKPEEKIQVETIKPEDQQREPAASSPTKEEAAATCN